VEAGSGGRSWASRPDGWAGGLLGCAVLGLGASGLGKEKEKRAAAGLLGWARWGKGKMEKGFGILGKGSKQMEFKF
jgi:hypothetical protein